MDGLCAYEGEGRVEEKRPRSPGVGGRVDDGGLFGELMSRMREEEEEEEEEEDEEEEEEEGVEVVLNPHSRIFLAGFLQTIINSCLNNTLILILMIQISIKWIKTKMTTMLSMVHLTGTMLLQTLFIPGRPTWLILNLRFSITLVSNFCWRCLPRQSTAFLTSWLHLLD